MSRRPPSGQGSRPGVEVQRERILDAAADMLVKQGIETISVDALRKEAEVSRATFYRCFKNLDEVVAGLYARMETEVSTRLLDMLPEDPSDPESWVPAVVERVFSDARRGGPLTAALFREEMRPGSPAKTMRRRRVDRQAAAIADWWSDNGDDDDVAIARMIVLLMQIAGLELALHPRMPKAKREAMQRAMEHIMAATVERRLED